MKKVMTIVGAVMIAVCIMAQSPVYRTKTLTLAAGVTNVSDYIPIADVGVGSYREIDRVVAVHTSGPGTGTVSFAASDIGTSYTLYTTGNLITLAEAFDWPKFAYVSGQTVNLVTGNVFVVKTNVSTNYQPYSVRMLKVTVSQPSSPLQNVYDVSVFAK